MPLRIATTTNGNGEGHGLPPDGVHQAICYAAVDLGTQENKKWGKWQPKVLLQFELCECLMEDTRPWAVTKIYTNSFYGDSHARRDMVGWFNKPISDEKADEMVKTFDWFTLVGKHATVQVMHSDDGKWANVVTITPPTDAGKKFQMNNKELKYALGSGEGFPDNMPDWIKAKIMSSQEWLEGGQMNHSPQSMNVEPPQEPSGGIDPQVIPDDIPF